VSLREARDKADAARKQAANGLDPIAERERELREQGCAESRRRSRYAHVPQRCRSLHRGRSVGLEKRAHRAAVAEIA